MIIPKVTDADRGAGFYDLQVEMVTGTFEKIRMFRPEHSAVQEIRGLPTMTERVLHLTAHSLREGIPFLETISPPYLQTIYIVANLLMSEREGIFAINTSTETGRLMLEELKPGLSRQLGRPETN